MPNKSVSQKLLIKKDYTVALVNAPRGYKRLLGELPKGVRVENKPKQEADLIQGFVADRRELETQLPRLKPHGKPTTILWVSYVKGTSTKRTGINHDSLYTYAQSIGLEGVAMISMDDDWSAMRFKLA